MTSQLDIWRAAKLMIDQYGKGASMEAARRSNSALEKKDQANYEIWQRVAMAIIDFERRQIFEGESIH